MHYIHLGLIGYVEEQLNLAKNHELFKKILKIKKKLLKPVDFFIKCQNVEKMVIAVVLFSKIGNALC